MRVTDSSNSGRISWMGRGEVEALAGIRVTEIEREQMER